MKEKEIDNLEERGMEYAMCFLCVTWCYHPLRARFRVVRAKSFITGCLAYVKDTKQ
jgi:hypothetical protein